MTKKKTPATTDGDQGKAVTGKVVSLSKSQSARRSAVSKKKGRSHRAPGTEIDRPAEPFRLSATGLVVNGNPTFEQAAEYMQKIQQIDNSTKWGTGDMIRYGEGRADWREMWSQLLQDTMKSSDTLQTYRNVAEKFSVERRRPLLSFSHHRELARLPELDQERWLDRCEHEGLSALELRGLMKGLKEKREPTIPFNVADETDVVAIVVPIGQDVSAWRTEPLANREMARLNMVAGSKAYEVRVSKVQGPEDVDGDMPQPDATGDIDGHAEPASDDAETDAAPPL